VTDPCTDLGLMWRLIKTKRCDSGKACHCTPGGPVVG
jgi:hypothetical protein